MAGSSNSLLKASVRLTAASGMIFGYRSLNGLAIDSFISNQYGGHLQYLTIQGLAIACATMLIGIGMEILPFLRGLRTLRRYLFVMAMPLAVVISSIYWTLLIFFPKLILSAELSVPSTPSSSTPTPFRLPLSTDLALHACPAVSLLVDFFAFESKYSRKEVNVGVPILVALYALFYGGWVEHCATRNNDVFPYPFLTASPFKIRLVIYAGAAVLAITSFRFLNKIHSR